MLYTSQDLRKKLLMASVAGAFAFTPVAATSALAQSATETTPTVDRIVEEPAEPSTEASDSATADDAETTVGAEEMESSPDATASESVTGESDSEASTLSGSDSMETDDTAAGDMATDEDESLAGDGTTIDTETTSALPEADEDGAAMTGIFLEAQAVDQVMANNYIGQSVYNGAGEKVGDITDLVFTKDGGIEAAVVGVGGFLGLGQHNVAVDFSQIDIVENPEGEIELTIAAEREELAEAPAFQTKEDRLAEVRSQGNMTPAAPSAPVE